MGGGCFVMAEELSLKSALRFRHPTPADVQVIPAPLREQSFTPRCFACNFLMITQHLALRMWRGNETLKVPNRA